MGFSVTAEGRPAAHLPDAPWRPLVSKLGYGVGFLVVVPGRQQLFTENTLTPVLPLLQRKDRRTAANVLRLWAAVLAANLLGALAVALAVAHTGAFDPHAGRGRRDRADDPRALLRHPRRPRRAHRVAHRPHGVAPPVRGGGPGGIALADVVGIGEFGHVDAGSVEASTVAATGQASWGSVLLGHVAPTLIGNVVGGVTLVALLNHAQVVAGGGGKDV